MEIIIVKFVAVVAVLLFAVACAVIKTMIDEDNKR